MAHDPTEWVAAGYDYVPIEQGLQQSDVIRRQSMHELEAHYAVESDEAVVRSWATEGKGLISTMAEFEAFRWPDPDALDYGAFDRIGPLLPPTLNVIAVLGKIFSCVWWLMGLEGMSLALADEPELVPRVFRKVGEIQLRVFERMLRYDCVGTFWHADDVASSNSIPEYVPLANFNALRQATFDFGRYPIRA